jgi:hypothetical protein
VAQAGGKYTSSSCTVLAKTSKTSLFEFEPGAVNSHFTFAGTAFTQEGETSRQKVSCTASRGEGVYASPTTVELAQFELTGCQVKSAKVTCQTEAAEGNSTEGKINVYRLDGALGKTSGTKAGVLLSGVVSNPIGGSSNLVMRFECGGHLTGKGADIFVEGSIIGELIATDRMAMTSKLKFAKNAITLKQAITHFEGEAEEHELVEVVFLAGGEVGFANWVGTPIITNEEPLEIKSK